MSQEQVTGSSLEKISTGINAEICEDPVGRGTAILKKYLEKDLQEASKDVFSADHAYILTGFYIPDAGTIETDGLSGALFLSKALKRLGKDVTLFLDDNTAQIVSVGVAAINADISLKHLHENFHVSQFEFSGLAKDQFSHIVKSSERSVLIAVERPGMCHNGQYRTMRGAKIPNCPIDVLFNHYYGHGNVSTISCADGLNEVGMGNLPKGIIERDEGIQSITKVDNLIVAGIADWAAFGLIAGISFLTGKDLLPSPEEQETLLRILVNAGAVDGITKKRDLTIDTLPLPKHIQKVERLKSLLS